MLQTGDIMRFEQHQNIALERRRGNVTALARTGQRHRVQLLVRERDDLAGTHPDVHQPLDRAELAHVVD